MTFVIVNVREPCISPIICLASSLCFRISLIVYQSDFKGIIDVTPEPPKTHHIYDIASPIRLISPPKTFIMVLETIYVVRHGVSNILSYVP